MRRNAYTIEYKMTAFGEVKRHTTLASSKEEAWEQATFYDIPYIEKTAPYSVWVFSVTYKNGNYRRFNTFEGKPY